MLACYPSPSITYPRTKKNCRASSAFPNVTQCQAPLEICNECCTMLFSYTLSPCVEKASHGYYTPIQFRMQSTSAAHIKQADSAETALYPECLLLHACRSNFCTRFVPTCTLGPALIAPISIKELEKELYYKTSLLYNLRHNVSLMASENLNLPIVPSPANWHNHTQSACISSADISTCYFVT